MEWGRNHQPPRDAPGTGPGANRGIGAFCTQRRGKIWYNKLLESVEFRQDLNILVGSSDQTFDGRVIGVC